MKPAADLVSLALRTPEKLEILSLAQWDRLVRQARRTGLLARIAIGLSQRGLADLIPTAACWHFEADECLAEKQAIAVRWEVAKIHEAFEAARLPVILLKGAAYVLARLPAAGGRLFNDVDILVPRERVAEAEAALMLAGWHTILQSEYDERYYRRWMHEIPPMRHLKRASVIDVHHGILPDTARYHPDAAKLRADAICVPKEPGIQVLAPVDMVLHSATHLFHDGELPHGLRDLSDLDILLRHFSVAPDFWMQLVERAYEMQLSRPLYHALRYTRHFLATPVPHAMDIRLKAAQPSAPIQGILDGMFTRVLAPDHASCVDSLSRPAKIGAYVRAHWLRMPPHLLAYHLAHKALFPPRAATN